MLKYGNLPLEGTADSAESKKRRRRELPAFIFLHKKPEYVEIKTRQNLQKAGTDIEYGRI